MFYFAKSVNIGSSLICDFYEFIRHIRVNVNAKSNLTYQ